MKPEAEVASERAAAILAHAPLRPKGVCHYCNWPVPKLALWCAADCAQQYEAEKAALLVK